jgi:hypothetical protein
MQDPKIIEEYVDLNKVEEEKSGLMSKINSFLIGKYFVPVVIVLIAIIGFSLGRISGLQDKREPVRVITSPNSLGDNPLNPPYPKGETGTKNSANLQNAASAVSANSSETVVASKNGTKYHYPWCAGAKQISAGNLVTFNSINEARAAGYTPASNCKGLK